MSPLTSSSLGWSASVTNGASNRRPLSTTRHGRDPLLANSRERVPSETNPGQNREVVSILVVEDEVRLARALADGLSSRGFGVTVCHDGQSAYQVAKERKVDVIVLDLMLPRLSGAEVCRRLRAEGVWTPILVLTAVDGESDETTALNIGADDYLRKPFSYPVLVARCRALLRRSAAGDPADLVVDDLVLDPRRRTVRRGDTAIDLTRREFAVLELLMRNHDRPLSKQEILDHVWGPGYSRDANVVEVYVGYLRRKVDQPFGRATVQTMRGQGYLLRSTS
jgi:DNA-binding response OmpR family regulator